MLWRREQDRKHGCKYDSEARSLNHCYRGRATSIIYFKFVSVALAIQHEVHMRSIVICSLSRSTTFLLDLRK
jgi:hypothetical protein